MKQQTFTDQIGARFYCIRNKNGAYWSNDWGWLFDDDSEVASFDIFTESEKQAFTLPVGEGAYWEIF